MIAWLMMRLGWSRLAVTVGLVAFGLLAAGGGLKLALWLHDRGVIEKHEDKIEAKVTRRALDAERSAEAKDREREATNRARSERLQRSIDDAIIEYPDAAIGGVGPVTQSVLDELRRPRAGEDRAAGGEASRGGGEAGRPAR